MSVKSHPIWLLVPNQAILKREGPQETSAVAEGLWSLLQVFLEHAAQPPVYAIKQERHLKDRPLPQRLSIEGRKK